MKSLQPNIPLILQCLIVALVLATVALMPPASGRILIVSLTGQSPGQIARWAIARDARLIGRGPLPHSLVVEGERSRLLDGLLAQGALALTGTAAGCGNGRAS